MWSDGFLYTRHIINNLWNDVQTTVVAIKTYKDAPVGPCKMENLLRHIVLISHYSHNHAVDEIV